ncbi:MAG: hypothetical protein ACTHOK_02315 [Nocardioidaceae bacterium]
MPELVRTTVEVPVRGGAAHWSYGTAIVGRPGTTEVLFTLPSAASRTPWARLDLASGELGSGSGMPGPLRFVHFPEVGEDPRWWVLGLHGVGRVHPEDPSTVHDVVRTGIGRYPNRLFSVGAAHLAVGTDLSGNVVLLSKTSTEPVGRLRLPKGSTSCSEAEGLIRVFAPREGKVYDVDPVRLKVARRHKIPCGKGERLIGETLFYLAGEITPIRVLAEGEAPQPGVPVVLGHDVGATVGATVVAREIVGVNVHTLQLTSIGPHGSVPVPARAVEVLGVDRDAHLVVSTQDGFVLVDAGSGAMLAEYVEPGGLVGAGMAQGSNTVALATASKPLGTVALMSW